MANQGITAEQMKDIFGKWNRAGNQDIETLLWQVVEADRALASPPVAVQEEGDAKDAARYRWLKAQRGLSLETVAPSTWTREDGSTFVPTHRLCAGGTGFGAYPTMDETIDAAMKGDQP